MYFAARRGDVADLESQANLVYPNAVTGVLLRA